MSSTPQPGRPRPRAATSEPGAGNTVPHEAADRAPGGRRMAGLVLHYGYVPPEAGLPRVRWCLREGSELLERGSQLLGACLLELVEVFPGGLASLPTAYPLHMHTDPALAEAIGGERVEQWAGLRFRLDCRLGLRTVTGRIQPDLTGVGRQARKRFERAEDLARRAERDLAAAFHCLEEALQESSTLPDQRVASLLVRPELGRDVADGWMQAEVDVAHARAHQAGELVGGLFGCLVRWDGEAWMLECRIGAMHERLGLSAGFTASHECSVCGSDLVECDHDLGTAYDVVAARRLLRSDASLASADSESRDRCTICGGATCEHAVGETYSVVAQPRFADAVLQEVSVTPRPRDPRTRIASMELSAEELTAALGVAPGEGDVLWHNRCLYPCEGFATFPELETDVPD